MKSSRPSLTFLATALSQLSSAQENNNNFNNNAQIPTTCSNGFESRSDTVFLTLPYSYDSVVPLVSDFSNLSWANISPVTLNGTNNTPGTARGFSFGGADFVQTLLSYDKPPSPGPFVEVHNSAPVTLQIPPEQAGENGGNGKTNFTLWLDSLRFEVEGVCEGGRASQVNWTVSMCSDVPDLAKGSLHQIHTGFVENVGKLLGGGKFESCEDLGKGGEGGEGKGGEGKEGEKKEGEKEDEDEDEEDEDEDEKDEEEDEKDEKEKKEDEDEDEKEDEKEEEEDEDEKEGDGKENESEKEKKKKQPSQSYGEPPHYRRWTA